MYRMNSQNNSEFIEEFTIIAIQVPLDKIASISETDPINGELLYSFTSPFLFQA